MHASLFGVQKKIDTNEINESNRKYIKCTFIEAKDLLDLSRNGRSEPVLNAYIFTSLGVGHKVTKEDYVTKVNKQTLTPTWQESFMFGHSFDLSNTNLDPHLVIDIYNKSDKTPMGKVDLPIKTLTSVQNKWFPLEKCSGMTSIRGQLKCTIEVIEPEAEDAEASLSLLGINDADDKKYENEPPNELHIVILKGKKLLACDTGMFQSGLSDPLVKVKINGFPSKKTKYVPKTLDPVWNELFVISGITDISKSLELTCYDYDNPMKSDLIGKVVIPLREFADKKPTTQWYKLGNKLGEEDSEKRGKIQVQVQWKFSVQVKEQLQKAAERHKNSVLGKISGLIRSKEDSDPEEEGDGEASTIVGDPGAPQSTEEAEKAEEERKAAEEEYRKEIGAIDIKDGDYQVQVHIIEARELKAENMDGSDDPVVEVECFGKKQHTRTLKGQINCVWDEVLIFDMKHLAKESFEDGVIRVSVKDANFIIGKKKMIGAYAFDATSVYFSKDHEMYRKWVALMDDEDADDVGVQGYLKLSVSIIGPGEKPKVHDEEEELKEEKKREILSGGDMTGLVLMPPTIKKTWKWVVLTVYRAENLPVMDGATVVTNSKTDALLEVSFGGAKPLSTKTVTVEGPRKALNPIFNEELWYPISYPTSTQIIKCQVSDYNPIKANETIGTFFEKFNIIQRSPEKQTGMKWVNLYGSPEFKDSATVVSNVKKLVNRTKAAISEVDYKELYNHTPEKAPVWKGRVLVNCRIFEKRPQKYEQKFGDEIMPFSRKIKAPLPSLEPALKKYSLKAIVVTGSELPYRFETSKLRPKKYAVRISIGINEKITEFIEPKGGIIDWHQTLHMNDLDFPVDTGNLPDVFIYLIPENQIQHICYQRVSVQELLSVNSFKSQARWISLKEDKVINGLKDGEYPGQILVKLGFGSSDDARDSKSEWQDLQQKMMDHFPYLVRVNIYQCKDLIPSDSNGLADPYITVKFYGGTAVTCRDEWITAKPDGRDLRKPEEKYGRKEHEMTRTKWKTLYPTYYETFDFSVQMTREHEFMPMVTLQLYDQDTIGSEKMGVSHFNLNDAMFTDVNAWNTLPYEDPKWIDFFFEEPGDGQGHVLVSVMVIPLSKPMINLLSDPYPPPAPIIPENKPAFIEMIVVGLRNLAPYKFQSMVNPYLEIEAGTAHGEKKAEVTVTKASRKPNPSNPNILERFLIDVSLPVNPIFTQPLFLRVYDKRLGGFSKPMVAAGVIDLESKIPGSKTYKPPQSIDIYNEDDADDDEEVRPKETSIVENPMNETNERSSSSSVKAGGSTQRPSQQSTPGKVDDQASKSQKSSKFKRQNEAIQGIRDKLETDLDDDDFIATPEVPDIEKFILDRQLKEDTGAGLFGALQHVDLSLIEELKKHRDLYLDEDYELLDEDEEPAWRKDRTILSGALEDSNMIVEPFETYPLMRGKSLPNTHSSKRRKVGIFKGLVRVVYNKTENFFGPDIVKQLTKPQPYKVRLYVIESYSLAKMDLNLDGTPASSDPYLKVTLGDFKFDDRKNAVDDMVNCPFYKMIEIDAELPGSSQLIIDVMDKDTVGSDDLIGRTVIDLEDRWFDKHWQKLGEENMVSTPDAGDDGGQRQPAQDCRWKTKPLEKRTLYVDGNNAVRGTLEVWVDIMNPPTAIAFPPDNVSLPPTQIFQLRVVIWNAKDVPAMDSLENMSDLFVKCWPEGSDPQTTDTHWRAKKGKASWNYRLLFDVELGHNTRAHKFPYLHIQMWDKDILKYNDCVGETMLDIGKFYRKAYHKNCAVNFFETAKGAAMDRMHKKQKLKANIPDTKEDIPPDEDATEDQSTSADGSEEKKTAPTSSKESQKSPMPPREVDSDDDDVELVNSGKFSEANPMYNSLPSNKNVSDKKNDKRKDKGKIKDKKEGKDSDKENKKKGRGCFSCFSKREEEEDDSKPLLEDDEVDPKQKEMDDEEKEAAETATWLKSLAGIPGNDPADSKWLKLDVLDHNTGVREPRGQLCINIQLWPKDKAIVMPVGARRDDPNTNPYLPPPVGRLKWSWNPFVLGSQLCGPWICAQVFCCLISITFVILMIFCQPFLTLMINIIFFFG